MKIDKWMKALYLKYESNDVKLIFELSEKVCELSKQIDRMKNCGTCKYNTIPELDHKCKVCVKKGRGKYADWRYGL